MKYFQNFKKVAYTFGDEFEKAGAGRRQIEFVQDISQYVDIVDQVRQAAHFYNYYDIIENERPDQVSQFLYDTPAFHWTFWMMNDHIREQGWPLTLKQMDEKLKTDHPHYYIKVNADISNFYLQNEIVYGQQSGKSGKILKRDLDHGILIVDSTGPFQVGEAITAASQPPNTATFNVVSSGFEYNATHHYENTSKEYVDVSPTGPVPALYNEVTIADRYRRQNDALKQIKVIKPENMSAIASAYKKALRD